MRTWLAASSTDPAFTPGSICLVARRHGQLENRYKPLLEQAGIPACLVTKDERTAGDGVRLATMHRIKGLEFPKVLIAGVQDGELPTPRRSLDELSRAQHEDSERRLLFVAATRARDELVVTGFGTECRLLSKRKATAA